MSRTFVIVIVIIILLLIWWNRREQLEDINSVSTADRNPEQTDQPSPPTESNKGVCDNMPYGAHPTMYPVYKQQQGTFGLKTIADYTNVPTKLAEEQKKYEPKGMAIIDGKDRSKNWTALEEKECGMDELSQDQLAEIAEKGFIPIKCSDIETHTRYVQKYLDSIGGSIIKYSREAEDKKDALCQFLNSIEYDFSSCKNIDEADCLKRRQNNECMLNAAYMAKNCPASCGMCGKTEAEARRILSDYYAQDPDACAFRQKKVIDDTTKYRDWFYSQV